MRYVYRFAVLGFLVVGFALASPAEAAESCDVSKMSPEEKKGLKERLKRTKLREFLRESPVDWSCVAAKKDQDRKDKLIDKGIEYERKAYWGLGFPAFLLRSLAVTGQIGEGNSTGETLDGDKVAKRFDESKSTRRVDIGYKDKRILEDFYVFASQGPDALTRVNGYIHEFLLKAVTLDATYGYGRVVDLDGSNLDNLKTSTDWSVSVKYTLPLDRVLGFSYETE